MWPGISGTVGETTLAEAQISGHKHEQGYATTEDAPRQPRFGRAPDSDLPSKLDFEDSYGANYTGGGAYTSTVGGSQPHTHALSGLSGDTESLPPYYALALIMRCA